MVEGKEGRAEEEGGREDEEGVGEALDVMMERREGEGVGIADRAASRAFASL